MASTNGVGGYQEERMAMLANKVGGTATTTDMTSRYDCYHLFRMLIRHWYLAARYCVLVDAAVQYTGGEDQAAGAASATAL
eukprot:2866418-Rhodomonas_salina.1